MDSMDSMDARSSRARGRAGSVRDRGDKARERLLKSGERAGHKYLYRVKHGRGWRYVYKDDVAHHARPISDRERWRRDRSPKADQETAHRVAAHGIVPHAGVLRDDEVHGASRVLGGHRVDESRLNSAGVPIKVPNHNPHDEWNRHREILAARIGVVGDSIAHNESRLSTWTNGTGEGVTSAAELVELAGAAESGFKDVMHAACGAVAGATTFYGEKKDKDGKVTGDYAIKGAKRLGEKVEAWAKDDVEQGRMSNIEGARLRVLRNEVSDCLRGSILVDHPEQIGHAVAALREHARAVGADITVENKWGNEHKGAYLAVHARMLMPSPKGMIRTEVQIHPKALIEPKEEMHKVYDVTRKPGFDKAKDKDAYNASSKLVWTAGMRRLNEDRGHGQLTDQTSPHASPEVHEEAARAHEGVARMHEVRGAQAVGVARGGEKATDRHARFANAARSMARAHRVQASAKRGIRPLDVGETHQHLSSDEHDKLAGLHEMSAVEDEHGAWGMKHGVDREVALNRAAVSRLTAVGHQQAARNVRIAAMARPLLKAEDLEKGRMRGGKYLKKRWTGSRWAYTYPDDVHPGKQRRAIMEDLEHHVRHGHLHSETIADHGTRLGELDKKVRVRAAVRAGADASELAAMSWDDREAAIAAKVGERPWRRSAGKGKTGRVGSQDPMTGTSLGQSRANKARAKAAHVGSVGAQANPPRLHPAATASRAQQLATHSAAVHIETHRNPPEGGDRYSAVRTKLHQEAISAHTEGKTKGHDRPHAIVMMGGPGSGKGTVLKKIMGKGAMDNYVHVDPDEMKQRVPEYQIARARNAKDAASVGHEESSHMAVKLHQHAVAARHNILLDGTGKNAKKHIAKIKALKAAGYHVTVISPHIGVEEGVARVSQRADRSGRFVPTDVVRGAYGKIPGNFHDVAAHADDAMLIDNHNGPRVMWHKDEDGEHVSHADHYSRFREDAAESRKGQGKDAREATAAASAASADSDQGHLQAHLRHRRLSSAATSAGNEGLAAQHKAASRAHLEAAQSPTAEGRTRAASVAALHEHATTHPGHDQSIEWHHKQAGLVHRAVMAGAGHRVTPDMREAGKHSPTSPTKPDPAEAHEQAAAGHDRVAAGHEHATGQRHADAQGNTVPPDAHKAAAKAHRSAAQAHRDGRGDAQALTYKADDASTRAHGWNTRGA